MFRKRSLFPPSEMGIISAALRFRLHGEAANLMYSVNAICKTDYWAKAYIERLKRSPGESKAGLTCTSANRFRFHIVHGHNKPLHPEPIAQCHNTIKRDKSFSCQLISASTQPIKAPMQQAGNIPKMHHDKKT